MSQETGESETNVTITGGPSAQAWQSFKPIICGLYSQMSMKDLQKTMESEYGFVAS